jgi:hypothetical protein
MELSSILTWKLYIKDGILIDEYLMFFSKRIKEDKHTLCPEVSGTRYNRQIMHTGTDSPRQLAGPNILYQGLLCC